MSFSGLDTFLFLWGKVRFVLSLRVEGSGVRQLEKGASETGLQGPLLSPEETPHLFSPPSIHPQLILFLSDMHQRSPAGLEDQNYGNVEKNYKGSFMPQMRDGFSSVLTTEAVSPLYLT